MTTLVLALAALLVQAPAPGGTLTRDQMREFLRTARVIHSAEIGKGITRPLRLTLSDGRLTHDAAFQSVDEQGRVARFKDAPRGAQVQLNFIDAYRYNLAADALATLLGLGDMMPVHVERKWDGRTGSLSWWVDTMMDEEERLKRNVAPPDPRGWIDQLYRMRVFSALAQDTDRNLGNVLITPDWRMVMIDFTRAFRLQDALPNEKELERCDRALLGRLRSLARASVATAVADRLTGDEINALMKRRDRIVAHFDALIASRGEAAILY